MSQGGGGMVVAASLGAPRRHREDPNNATGVGSSASSRFAETEWEAREVCMYILILKILNLIKLIMINFSGIRILCTMFVYINKQN